MTVVDDASTSVVIVEETVRSCGLELLGRHLAGPVVAGDFEAELLAFLQIAHSSALDGGDVNEHILAAVVRLNEAKTLGGIEPFHCAGGHEKPSFWQDLSLANRVPGEFRTISKEGTYQKRAERENNNDRPSNIDKNQLIENNR